MYRVCVWLKDNSLEEIFVSASISGLEDFLTSYFEVPETRFVELYRDDTWLDSVSSLEGVRSAWPAPSVPPAAPYGPVLPDPTADIPVGPEFPTAGIADIFRRTAAAVRADRTPVTLVPVSHRDTYNAASRRCSIFCTPATTVGEFRAWYRRHGVGCIVTAWRAGRQDEGPVFEVRAV